MGAHAEQSIYRFRGVVSSFNVTRFGNADFAGGTRSRRRARRRRPVQRLTV
jgi:hypothetical protein